MENNLHYGKVKWFDDKLGYGFIVDESLQEYFLHFSNILCKGYKSLKEGDFVSYNLVAGVKGIIAVNVSKIDKNIK